MELGPKLDEFLSINGEMTNASARLIVIAIHPYIYRIDRA
jgi:hypothetical protein